MSEVAQAPQLRFPEFSGEWKEKKLDSVVSKFIVPMRDKPTDLTGSIPWCRIEDFDGMYLNQSKTGQGVSEETVKEMNLKVYPINTLLVSCSANLGFCAIVKKELITNQTFIGLQSNDNLINIEFLYYLMKLSSRRLNILSSGTTISYLSRREFENFKITTPSLPEQQKIAAFLTAVDNKIEQLSKKQALLGEYKKGSMQQIFSQAIRFKADDGSAFPVWEEKKLGDIGHTFNGLTGKTKDDFGRGKPYIQYMQIFESSKINIDNFGLVDVRDDENQKVAQYGDVFFTTSSETPDAVGYSSVLLDDIDKLYLNSFCFGFRPNSLDELSPNFAQFLLRSANFRRRVVRLAQGSTRYNMSKVQLMKEVISLPCLKEQTKIAIFLSSIDSKIEQVGKQLDESKQFKKALLQQMFV